MKKEKGFLDVNIIKRFPSQFPEISFLGYVSNLVNVEKFIATAGVLVLITILKKLNVILI